MFANISLPADKRARGYLAESRFFYHATSRLAQRLRGYLRVERADPLMDVRGIDGFVYHCRGPRTQTPQRIPFQLKTGFERGMECTTLNGIKVPILAINVDMSGKKFVDGIRKLLDAYDRSPCDYEERLCALEGARLCESERKLICLIARSRAVFAYDPSRDYRQQLREFSSISLA